MTTRKKMKAKTSISKLMLSLIVFMAMIDQVNAQEAEPIWEANTVILQKKKLGDGVFAVVPSITYEEPLDAPKPTSGGFIIGKKSVMVIESFLNGDMAAQVIALIRSETDLPIRYLVNTSYHGDHSYANYVFPAETIVIQHEGTKDYIASNFEADQKFMVGIFGTKRGIEKAMPREADITISEGDEMKIDLGDKVVELHTFGFGQTPGDLYVWEPQLKVIWVGNVLVSPKPGIPWMLDGRHKEVLATMKMIRDFLPEGATIVPGHYSPLDRNGFDFAISYVETLRSNLAKGIQKGWSLEKAKEKLPMNDFRGYPIFDWLHYEVNLPATYKELVAERSKASLK